MNFVRGTEKDRRESLKKTSKEHKEDSARREKAFQAELADMIKGPLTMTFSAQMPAYTYTSLCSVPELREPMEK